MQQKCSLVRAFLYAPVISILQSSYYSANIDPQLLYTSGIPCRFESVNVITCDYVQAVLPFLGFSTALFAFSSIVPFVLLFGGATILNLSLLTSDVWAAIARQAFFGETDVLDLIIHLAILSHCSSLL